MVFQFLLQTPTFPGFLQDLGTHSSRSQQRAGSLWTRAWPVFGHSNFWAGTPGLLTLGTWEMTQCHSHGPLFREVESTSCSLLHFVTRPFPKPQTTPDQEWTTSQGSSMSTPCRVAGRSPALATPAYSWAVPVTHFLLFSNPWDALLQLRPRRDLRHWSSDSSGKQS